MTGGGTGAATPVRPIAAFEGVVCEKRRVARIVPAGRIEFCVNT